MINVVNSLASRPDATTEIPNLFLASDYVKTYTDIAWTKPRTRRRDGR